MRGFRVVVKGAHCVVLMADDVAESLDKDAPAKDRAKCLAILKRLANDGRRFLNREQFRKEDSFPGANPGAGEVAVYAVKSYQVRVYGGFRDGNFLCVEFDLKKKNKANKQKLKLAAKKISA